MIEQGKLYSGQTVWYGALDFGARFNTSSHTSEIQCYTITRISSNYIYLKQNKDPNIKRGIEVKRYGCGFNKSLYESYEDAAFDWDCIIRGEEDRLNTRKDKDIERILTVKNKVDEIITTKRDKSR